MNEPDKSLENKVIFLKALTLSVVTSYEVQSFYNIVLHEESCFYVIYILIDLFKKKSFVRFYLWLCLFMMLNKVSIAPYVKLY